MVLSIIVHDSEELIDGVEESIKAAGQRLLRRTRADITSDRLIILEDLVTAMINSQANAQDRS